MPNRTHPHEVPTSRPRSRFFFFSVVVREGHLDTLVANPGSQIWPLPLLVWGLPEPAPLLPTPRPICLWRYPRETVVLAGGPSMDALRLRREPARGTRQAPLLHPSQFCGGCGFVTPPRASQAPL